MGTLSVRLLFILLKTIRT